MENSHLSSHDKDVLTRIFSPSLPYGDTLSDDVPTEVLSGDDTIVFFVTIQGMTTHNDRRYHNISDKGGQAPLGFFRNR